MSGRQEGLAPLMVWGYARCWSSARWGPHKRDGVGVVSGKAFSHNCRAKTGVGVHHQHATNDFCIAPRLAESGTHSMDGLMKEPSAQVWETPIIPLPWGTPFSSQPAIVKAFSHNCRAKTGVGVDHQHATNDFCIAPRLAESGARGGAFSAKCEIMPFCPKLATSKKGGGFTPFARK